MAILPKVGLGIMVKYIPIDVVMPVFNGIKYLDSQIASIYYQSIRPQRLIVRDDGSSDGSQKLIDNCKMKYGDWLQTLPSEGNLGCVANVNMLLQSTTAPYVALSDQDDIWLPDKIEKSILAMQELEISFGQNFPLLVHTDLKLIDADGKELALSFFNYQHLDPYRSTISDLALTNIVTGCTIFLNRSLLNKSLPIPDTALMHDWWLAMTASAFGKIFFIDTTTVLYRQHGKNILGAKGLGIRYSLKKLLRLITSPKSGVNTIPAVIQMILFQNYFQCSFMKLPSIMSLSRHKRWYALIKLPFSTLPSKHGPFRTLVLYLLILLLPKLELKPNTRK